MERGLQRGHEQGRPDPLAADVGDGRVDPAVGADPEVEVVARDLTRRDVGTVELVARDLRRALRQQALLDLAREGELAVHLFLLGRVRHQPRVLDLRGRDVGERREQAQVRLFEGAVPHPAVHVDQADDLAFVLEGRREHRLDAGEPDRVGQGNVAARGSVHQEQAVALLDDGGDQRAREADLLRRDPLGDPDDGGDELVGHAVPQEHHAPIRVQRLEHLVDEKLQQLVHGDVAEELDGQLVDDPQRLDEFRELLRRQPRIGLGVLAQELRRRLQDGVVQRFFFLGIDPHARRRFGFDLQGHAPDGDPVARFQGLDRNQALAVQKGPIARAQVFDGEPAVVVPDDAGMLAGEHLVGDRQVVHGGTADRGHRPVQKELLSRHARGGDVEVKHRAFSGRDSSLCSRGPGGGLARGRATPII